MASYKKQALAVAAAASMAVSLAACGGGDSSASSSGTLFYYMDKPIEHLDPQRTYTGRDITNFSRTIYRQLVSFPISTDPEEANTPTPDLATDAGTPSNGAKTWKFTIKDGVKWEDGKAITCEDFKYGASRTFATDVITGGPNYSVQYLDIPTAKDGSSVYKGPYTKVGQADYDKAVTCDGNTITYNFKNPWPDFNLAVASLHMMDPYREDKDQGDKSNYQVFANGPYKLEGTWNKNKGGTFVRNENYDKATDSTDLRQANPEKITFKIGDSAETIYDRLFADSGDDKFAVTQNRVPPAYYSKLTGPVEDRTVTVESPYVDYLVPNMSDPAMKNPKVRQALAMATDQQGWIDAGGGSRAWAPAKSIVNPAVSGSQDNPNFKEFDAAAAKKVLEGAGVQMPVKITFTYPKSDTADKQAAALQQGWQQAGFEVKLEGLGETYYDVIQKPQKKSSVVWAGWGADWPSAITVTPALFDSAQLGKETNGQNYGGYKSQAFQRLINQARAATDLDEQTKVLQDADALLGKDTVYIPLEIAKFNFVHGSKVTNFENTPASSMYPDLGPIGVE